MLIRGMNISSGLVILSYVYEDDKTTVMHDILVKCVCDGNEFYIDVDSLMYSDEDVTVYTSVDSYVKSVLPDCEILSVRDAK